MVSSAGKEDMIMTATRVLEEVVQEDDNTKKMKSPGGGPLGSEGGADISSKTTANKSLLRHEALMFINFEVFMKMHLKVVSEKRNCDINIKTFQ
jgi:hypothetical protein